MCSAHAPVGGEPEPTTADRIVDAACELIAQRGVADSSVREVARRAGVSAPLVVHHFGSKSGLVKECDRRVADALDQALAPMRAGESVDSIEGGWVELLRSTPYLAYVTRSIRDGGELGGRLFDELFAISRDTDTAMQEAGVARSTADPDMRVLLLMALDMGMLLLSDHVERALGSPLTDPETAQRWVTSVIELLSNGLLTAPDSTVEGPP